MTTPAVWFEYQLLQSEAPPPDQTTASSTDTPGDFHTPGDSHTLIGTSYHRHILIASIVFGVIVILGLTMTCIMWRRKNRTPDQSEATSKANYSENMYYQSSGGNIIKGKLANTHNILKGASQMYAKPDKRLGGHYREYETTIIENDLYSK